MITAFYRIFGEDDLNVATNEFPNAFEIEPEIKGLLTLSDIVNSFPIKSHFFNFQIYQNDEITEIPSNLSTPIYINRDKTIYIQAVIISEPPRYSKLTYQIIKKRNNLSNSNSTRRKRTFSGSDYNPMKLSFDGAASLNQWASYGIESVGSIFHQVQDVVNSVTGYLSIHSTVNIGDKSFTLSREIAEGGFGKVFLVKDNKNHNKEYAMKQINAQTKEAVQDAENEIQILNEINHRNVMKLLASTSNNNKERKIREYYLIFPYYEKGTVWNLIELAHASHRPAFTERKALEIILGVCHGLSAIHQHGYAHRDVKPHNILLDHNDNAILTDLGSASKSKIICNTRNECLQLEDDASINCSGDYRSPELTQVVRGSMIDERVDVWSLGCTLYAMAYGYSPFFSPTEGIMTLAIINANYSFPHKQPGFSPKFNNIIRFCLNGNHMDRPFIIDIITEIEKIIHYV